MDYKDFLNMRAYFESDWYDKPYPHSISNYPKGDCYYKVAGASLLCYWQGVDKFCERLAAQEPIATSLENAKVIPAYLYSWKWAFGDKRDYGSKPSFYLMDTRDDTCVFGIHAENIGRIEGEEDFVKYHHFFLWSLQGHIFMGECTMRKQDAPLCPDWFWYEQRHLFPYYKSASRYIHHKRGLYVPQAFEGRTYFLNWAQVGHKLSAEKRVECLR